MELFHGRPQNAQGRLDKEMRVYDLLDSLGIPLEKATYLCSLYKTEEGILYQVSYRVAGNILSATEQDKNAAGRCIHETYPYGAPDFPQPHFDVEFYSTLPHGEDT